jgi:hypothetical protein
MRTEYNRLVDDVQSALRNPLVPEVAKNAMRHARDLLLNMVYRIESLERQLEEKKNDEQHG